MKILGILTGSILVAIAFNLFLIPHEIMSSGISGLSIILGMFTPFNAGIYNLLLNFPLLIIGYMKLGRTFIINTILSVISISVSLYFIPIHEIATNSILSSVFGGALVGLGIGIIFRSSGSSGGFDIIGMLLTRHKDFPMGTLLFGMNGFVILISGFLISWDASLNTLVSIFVTGKVIDSIHTHHVKITLMIITKKGEEMRQQLLSNVYRGVTMIDSVGGYSNEKSHILMTVVTRYELTEIKNLIHEVDPTAFVNITQTIEVMGLFHKKEIAS
ncbi:YitT family protein [Bacillus sp. CGMCC 1.16607]|uniref:YitT family protein n=1 Tax=Bacillus sp. CGMCC 1.16607 TaxID=3351842 RepID=UPI0036385611